MPASFIQAKGISNVVNATALTSTAISFATGSFLFVHTSHYTNMNISSVIQTTGANTFLKAGTTQGGDANQDNELWYTPNPVVGTTSATFQVRFTGSAEFRLMQVAEFSWGGVTSISYEAEAAHALATGSARTSLTLTPLVSDNLILGCWVAYDGAVALSSGPTTTLAGDAVGSTADDFALGYRLVDSVSAYTVSLIGPTPTGRYSVIAKAFKGVGGTATATAAGTFSLPLVGVGR